MMEMMDDVLGFVFGDKQFECWMTIFFLPNDEQIRKSANCCSWLRGGALNHCSLDCLRLDANVDCVDGERLMIFQ